MRLLTNIGELFERLSLLLFLPDIEIIEVFLGELIEVGDTAKNGAVDLDKKEFELSSVIPNLE
jgi:hypothetical protein